MKPELTKKQFAAKVEADDSDERTIIAIISTSCIDRDGEVLLPRGCDTEAFMKNPVVPWVHDYRDTPMARALWVVTGRDKIKAKLQFPKKPDDWDGYWKPDELYYLYKEGYLNAFSVGFLPRDYHEPTPDEIKKRPELAEARRIYDDWELLEFSGVPVPANSEALAIAVKGKSLDISDETIKQLGIKQTDTPINDIETEKDNTVIPDETKEVKEAIDDKATDDKITDEPEPAKVNLRSKVNLRPPVNLKRHIDYDGMATKACKKLKGVMY